VSRRSMVRVLTSATSPRTRTTLIRTLAPDAADRSERSRMLESGNDLCQLDANGRPTRTTDSNGVVTTLAYHPRGWLASRTVNSSQSTPETTTYGYDGVGQLTRITLPDGSWIAYLYDDAHRLTEISDGVGNVIQYTLDSMGNRISEEVYDPQDALKRRQTRVYDSMNLLQRTLGGVDPTKRLRSTRMTGNGNVTDHHRCAWSQLGAAVRPTQPAHASHGRCERDDELRLRRSRSIGTRDRSAEALRRNTRTAASGISDNRVHPTPVQRNTRMTTRGICERRSMRAVK
jgi:YD repeat-containing protein